MKPFWIFALMALTLARVGDAATVVTSSPDGSIQVSVSDTGGLNYKVTQDGKTVLTRSRLGMTFEGGWSIGLDAQIGHVARLHRDEVTQNLFGKRRYVRDNYHESVLDIAEAGPTVRRYGVIVRAYNDGIALRYVLPKTLGADTFVVTDEATEFVFPADARCWGGDFSNCVECHYPERRLLELTASPQQPSVLPVLAQSAGGYAAITEADLRDWAGMFLVREPAKAGAASVALKASLAMRQDGHGLVVSATPRLSPWRVVMLGRKAGDLYGSDLIWNLATPSRLTDTSWIKPGITAWDPWWAGSVGGRGTTESDKKYIDFAASMKFPYQLVDWGWYQNSDVTKIGSSVDVLALRDYAAARGVKLLLWMDSNALKATGVDKAFSTVASWGIPGVKVDFMNSDSQETVQWYESTLQTAAKYKLMVDFHGAYKPTGLARTWPNYITQEGVMGNEYNKLNPDACTLTHTITLPFTRALLGPMDFTPGGFVNVTRADFVTDAGSKPGGSCEVVGTRVRQLAETVVYPSPLLCLCDSPANYTGQSGVEFFRGLPTVWDDTVVLSADVAKQIVVARRSGSKWYLAAMDADQPLSLSVPLTFLGKGKWSLESYQDTAQSETTPTSLAHAVKTVQKADVLTLSMATGGGFVGILSPH